MGMKSPAKKKEIVKRSRPTDAELGKIDSNNGDAGKIISDLTAGCLLYTSPSPRDS